MHCSSFEPLLDEFVDGTLSPLARARVLKHVEGCDHCRGLLEELRVVDALLLTPRQLEPAPNFTFRTMAEASAVPTPHVHRTPAFVVIAVYLAFAWLAIGAWFALGGPAARATLGFVGAQFVRYGQSFAELGPVSNRLFGASTSDVGVAMGAILALDLLLAFGLVAFFVIRPRRMSRVAQPPESSS